MVNSYIEKNFRRFKIRKYAIIALFSILMVTNTITLMQSFYGQAFALINGILALTRFLLYGQLIATRVAGKNIYAKFLVAMIVIELVSFFPQILLDYEILSITYSVIYYILLDAFSQGLLIFLLIDEYFYISSLSDDISSYQNMLKNSNKNLKR